ncbi:hypothetical protein DNTS_004113 [Danionella cerebrum]|uniref:A-kinase anchor protein 2 C-terminal domain-containing protein n=1 Tax=Danionella cerebrum TaxID=2873325 RepID=A0A553MUI8_9TELE|nr:hypothetical protein DNTS_004113 [Danionella translucida]
MQSFSRWKLLVGLNDQRPMAKFASKKKKNSRATAGVRRSHGSDLSEGKETLLSEKQKEQEYLSDTFTMENDRHSEMTDLRGCEMDHGSREDQTHHFSGDEDECFSRYFSECLDTRQSTTQDDLDGPLTKHLSIECDSSGDSYGSKDSQEAIVVKHKQEEPEDTEPFNFQWQEESSGYSHSEDQVDTNNLNDAQQEEHYIPVEIMELQDESALEHQMDELGVSEVLAESCDERNQDFLSDRLDVETILISSDSDAEEPWRSVVSPAANLLESDETEANMEDHPISDNAEHVDGDQGGNEILEQPDCPTECELQDISFESSVHYCSLTKIAEDDEEHEKPTKHNLQRLSCSTSELDKKLPQDFCVIQEMKSENVSTEHLDFTVARRQWKEMEEQTKGRVHQPLVRQGSSQGGHNHMYTPVRNIDRPRRDPDIESLSLGDQQHPQFSPCSEDSGLDDVNYRSPYDEPETPVEREIREALEREENFRKERTMAKMSTGNASQTKARLGVLPHSRSEPGEKGRMFDTPEDRCRSQRTPTLSITASSGKSPTYHEMTANNVIILEPDSYSTSQWNRGKGGLLSPGSSSIQELPSDMNNVIILETSNLIIRSASEFCLSTACREQQESTFQNNPFFKLRSHSTQSLVDQEIKLVRQREEEMRRERAHLYIKERYDTVLVSSSQVQNLGYGQSGEIPAKSKSSPSSPSKTRKMDRPALSCDHKFPVASFHPVRRKSALALRWEAGIFANHQQQE